MFYNLVIICIKGVACLKKTKAENSFLDSIKELLLKICKMIEAYTESNEIEYANEQLFFVSIETDGIYLNGKKIISKRAKLQMAIFMILAEHYIDEFFSSPSYLSFLQISSRLQKKGIYAEDIENQVRMAIYRIRLSVQKSEGIDTNIISQSKYGGYRLENSLFLSR